MAGRATQQLNATGNSPTGSQVGGGSPIPGAIAPRPAAPAPNGLAAFAASPLGQQWNATYNQPNPYIGAFQSGLTQARSNIAQQLQGSLADIQNSQRQAGVALGQYAPTINSDYAAATGENRSDAAAAGQALAHYGVKPSAMSNAFAQGDQALVNNTRNQDLSQQSLLSTGIAQQGEHEQALAALAAQQAQGNLDQSQMQFNAGMAQSQAQDQQAMRMALLSGEQQAANNKQNFGYNMALTNASNSTKANNNPATGPYASTGLTQGAVDAAQATPQYKNFSNLIGKYKAGTEQANVLAGQIIAETNGNPHLQMVLKAENPDFFKNATPINQQPGMPNSNPYYQNGLLNTIASDNSLTGRIIQAPGRGLVWLGQHL